MKRSPIVLIWSLIALILWTGCPGDDGDGESERDHDPQECLGETEEALCGDRECGSYSVVDQCGEARMITCGECGEEEACVDGGCRCVGGESDVALCDREGLECGVMMVEDRCGEARSVECGGCEGTGEVCEANQCRCEPESNAELCLTRPEGECGVVMMEDRCGLSRELSCQDCVDGESTIGVVRDGLTGAAISGAEVRIWTWPPPGGEQYSWEWPQNHRLNDADAEATTGSVSGGINFELVDGEALCLNDVAPGGLQPRQWYRIRIDHPDYQSAVYYREHGDFRQEDCPGYCPASPSSGCFRMEFDVYPRDQRHRMAPNLVVDRRDLEDHLWQCALLPGEERVIGLRVRIGAGNVGLGPLHMEATPGGENGEVLQYLHYSDGTVESRVVESGTFTYFDDHFHIHFMEWFAMRLVNPVESCRDVENRAESCILHRGTKISYCLHDLDPFDGDVRADNDQVAPSFPNPPTCDTTQQGVSAGWKDTYRKRLPGQLIIVGSPQEAAALGEVWIEAQVDPAGVLVDEDRSSMIARIAVNAPTDIDALCSDPATTRDCRGNPADFNADQRRQCRDYLNFANSED